MIIMPNELHSHGFRGRTTFSDGHTHEYSGITSMNPDIPGHVHYMAGVTAFNDGHVHRYSLYTSPEIQVDRGHTHYYRAATSFEDGHVHYLFGYTTIYGQ